MNGFRVTLLVLLTLAVAALLCIVTIFQSNQEANYEAYLADVKARERQQLLAAHEDKMRRIGPQEEQGAAADALQAARDEQLKQVTEEEERNVLASAVRKDAAKVEDAATQEANAEKPLGLVSSFNKEWGFVMIKPVTEEPLPSGMVVAVRRGDNIICEVEIGEEELDEQTGARLVSATIRENQFTQGSSNISEDKFDPTVGDEIIFSPSLSSRDLRTSAPADMQAAPFAPLIPAGSPMQEGVQEVDATLTPMP